MKLICWTDLSHEGSACWIYENVGLMESNGMYFVVHTRRISVDHYYDSVETSCPMSMKDAYRYYRELGGDELVVVD